MPNLPSFVPRRLDKFLRDSTTLTVAGVARAWAAGRVRLERNPASATRGLREIVFEEDVVTLDGDRVLPRTEHVCIALNKPRAVTSTANDPTGKKDLSSFLEQMPEGVFQIGRLDRMTTGLLLFTTDGDLASAITRPDHATEKVYWLWLNESLEVDDPRLAALTGGVSACGRRMRAHRVELMCATRDCAELLVTLREGRKRQIRRMCRKLDLRLLHLHRRSVGPVDLDGLSVGTWRTLAPGEIDALWASTGGRERTIERKIAALGRAAAAARAAGEPMERLDAWLEATRGPEP